MEFLFFNIFHLQLVESMDVEPMDSGRPTVLIHVTKWMNLENTMLSERSQTQRPHII